MGTRADFYLGCGSKAEWLGSVGFDGHSWAEDPRLATTTTEAEWRKVVDEILDLPHATRPSQGWPWPWKTSATTDFVYWFDNGVQFARFDKEHDWPDMSAVQNVTLGARSGLTIVGKLK